MVENYKKVIPIIEGFAKGDEDFWTLSGSPDVNKINLLLGTDEQITASHRDQVWEYMKSDKYDVTGHEVKPKKTEVKPKKTEVKPKKTEVKPKTKSVKVISDRRVDLRVVVLEANTPTKVEHTTEVDRAIEVGLVSLV